MKNTMLLIVSVIINYKFISLKFLTAQKKNFTINIQFENLQQFATFRVITVEYRLCVKKSMDALSKCI